MPYAQLTPEHQSFLAENCRLCLKKPSDGYSIAAEDLLHLHTAEAYIEKIMPLIKAPNQLVTASQFSKRYAFLMVAPFFSSFSLLNRVLDIQPNNCVVEAKQSDGHFLPELSLLSLEAKQVNKDRKIEMESGLEQLFRNHISVIWGNLAKTSNVPFPVLWENTATYIYWLYETTFAKHAEGELKATIAEDFQNILDAPGECFGLKYNPFKKYYFEKQPLIKSDPGIRVRKTCCLYYEISPDRTFCKNCPRCLSGYVPQPTE